MKISWAFDAGRRSRQTHHVVQDGDPFNLFPSLSRSDRNDGQITLLVPMLSDAQAGTYHLKTCSQRVSIPLPLWKHLVVPPRRVRHDPPHHRIPLCRQEMPHDRVHLARARHGSSGPTGHPAKSGIDGSRGRRARQKRSGSSRSEPFQSATCGPCRPIRPSSWTLSERSKYLPCRRVTGEWLVQMYRLKGSTLHVC